VQIVFIMLVFDDDLVLLSTKVDLPTYASRICHSLFCMQQPSPEYRSLSLPAG